jgi:hypothetical protein
VRTGPENTMCSFLGLLSPPEHKNVNKIKNAEQTKCIVETVLLPSK